MKPVNEVVSKRIVVRRRRFTQEFKRRAVEQTLAPGASTAGIALKYRLNSNVLFKWRRQFTATEFTDTVLARGCKLSMDGRAAPRATTCSSSACGAA